MPNFPYIRGKILYIARSSNIFSSNPQESGGNRSGELSSLPQHIKN
jgi:hypothetical protein